MIKNRGGRERKKNEKEKFSCFVKMIYPYEISVLYKM